MLILLSSSVEDSKKKKKRGRGGKHKFSCLYRKLHDVQETITLDVWGGSRIEVRRGRKRTEYLENILLYSLVPLNFEPCKCMLPTQNFLIQI